MGRDRGYLAPMSGMAGGAECVVLPETPTDPDTLARDLCAAYLRGKSRAILVVAEGATLNSDAPARHFKEYRDHLGFELRVTKLGHVRRGSTPGAFHRLLSTGFGAAAIEHIATGQHGDLIGLIRHEIVPTPPAEVAGRKKLADLTLLKLAKMSE